MSNTPQVGKAPQVDSASQVSSAPQAPAAPDAAVARRGGKGAAQPLRTGLRILEIVLFLGAVIMVNVSSASGLFQRLDLTESGLYSLSPPSIDAVFRAARAAHHPRLLHPEPARPLQHRGAGGARTCWRSTRCTEASSSTTSSSPWAPRRWGQEEAIANEELARQYLIYPIQIERLERDEVTLSTAYTGMALIHGDLIETIPSITDTDQLELTITEAITKLTERISSLLALEEDIMVRLYFSSPLTMLAPGVDQFPAAVEELVKELKRGLLRPPAVRAHRCRRGNWCRWRRQPGCAWRRCSSRVPTAAPCWPMPACRSLPQRPPSP